MERIVYAMIHLPWFICFIDYSIGNLRNISFIFFKALAAGKSIKEIKKEQKPEKKGSLKKKKKDEEQQDNSLKGIDVRQLHEAYQTLMKKYCPDAKKKSGESEDSGPKDDCAVGMIAF